MTVFERAEMAGAYLALRLEARGGGRRRIHPYGGARLARRPARLRGAVGE
jgi:hypothetical protein